MFRSTLWMALVVVPATVCAGDAELATPASPQSNQPADLDAFGRPDAWVAPGVAAPNVGQKVDPLRPDADPAPRAGQRTSLDGPASLVSSPASPELSRPVSVGDRTAGDSRKLAPRQRSTTVPWYRSGLVSLALVLAAIAGITLLVRRWVPAVRTMSGGAIEILGRNHLAPKQSLTLVRVGRRIVLVGVTPERLSTLCVIDDPQEVAELAGAAPGGRSLIAASEFDEALDEAVTTFDELEPESLAKATEPTARLRQAKGQLQGLMSRLRSMQDQA